jgi:hypothetical protein
VRNDCLRGREFKTSFLQELLDQGLDFSFQQFFRFTGDDEVIRVADEIDTRYFSCKSRSSPSSAQLASAGEIIPPWGVPSVVS